MVTIKIFGIENMLNEVDTGFKKRVGLMEVIELISETPLTVKEALSVYCNKYGSYIEPYDGSNTDIPIDDSDNKYFFYYYPKSGNRSIVYIKQDLSHLLEDGDELTFGYCFG